MFTTKFIIKKDRNNALRLRVVSNRKNTEISLGYNMDEETLIDCLSDNPKRQNIPMASVFSGWIAKIADIKATLSADGRNDEEVDIVKAMILESFFREQKQRKVEIRKEEQPQNHFGEFVTWFCKFADSHNTPGARTKKDYYHTLSRLRAFDSGLDNLAFTDITMAWLEDFDNYLSATCKVNSRNHHMRNIRAVFKYAIRHDLDIRNPFDRMRLKTERTAKRSLTLEELREIFSMEVQPYAEIYRDMFKLSFMLIGINPIDLFRLKGISSHGRIDYSRAKTHKPYSIKVEPEAMEIIKKYRGSDNLLMLSERWKLPASFGTAANTALQYLGSLPSAKGRKKADSAKYPELTMYWARHTWATIARKIGVSIDTIAAALGHSSSHKTTEIYIDEDLELVDEANRRVLDWVLYGKR